MLPPVRELVHSFEHVQGYNTVQQLRVSGTEVTEAFTRLYQTQSETNDDFKICTES